MYPHLAENVSFTEEEKSLVYQRLNYANKIRV